MLQLLSLFLLSLLSVQQFYPYLTIHLVQTSSNICQSVRTSRRWPGHNSPKPIPAQSYRTRLMPKADCPLPPPPRTLLQLNRTTLFCWKSYCFDNHYHSNAPTLPTTHHDLDNDCVQRLKSKFSRKKKRARDRTLLSHFPPADDAGVDSMT